MLATTEAPGELRKRLTPNWQTRWGDDGNGASGKEEGVDARVIATLSGSGAAETDKLCCSPTI